MKLRHVTTKYVFDADDQPILRNKKRNKFRPQGVIVTHRTGPGFWNVRVYGLNTGPAEHGTDVIFGIKNNLIQANSVGRAPQWLQDIVDQAVALHDGEMP